MIRNIFTFCCEELQELQRIITASGLDFQLDLDIERQIVSHQENLHFWHANRCRFKLNNHRFHVDFKRLDDALNHKRQSLAVLDFEESLFDELSGFPRQVLDLESLHFAGFNDLALRRHFDDAIEQARRLVEDDFSVDDAGVDDVHVDQSAFAQKNNSNVDVLVVELEARPDDFSLDVDQRVIAELDGELQAECEENIFEDLVVVFVGVFGLERETDGCDGVWLELAVLQKVVS